MFLSSQVRVVLLAAAPIDRLFVHAGGEDERDRQLLDDLGLSGVTEHFCSNRIKQVKTAGRPNILYHRRMDVLCS